ncbi:class I SAM-dependent methyltransferase [Moorena producens]|uniref:class I SAM-dependent methyltransferase n=1 Tax=Moorena producens TaxID=1155739 RepID=UPI003C7268CD
MQDLSQDGNWFKLVADIRTSQQNKTWFNSVADAYNRTRPTYPQTIVDRAVELAQLPDDATILEIGCGPGTVTRAFGQLGFRMVCIEPSESACKLARQNCAQYPNVEIKNTTFEEWELESQRFDAVIAATAFHWVAPGSGYAKVNAALKQNGVLIILWNTRPHPQAEVYQMLDEVYQIHAPSLRRYAEDTKTQLEKLNEFVEKVIDSGYFYDCKSEYVLCEPTYSIDDYLALLSTYSTYINLESQQKNSLFAGLRETLEKNCGNRIQLSYVSAFWILQKG